MKKVLPFAALMACNVIAVVMLILKPFPHGYRYGLAPLLSVGLTLIWLAYSAGPRLLFKEGVLAVILLCGLGMGVKNLLTIRGNVELVPHYQSLFDAIEGGKNPYTAGTIFHRVEPSQTVLGNFNYPPLEIYPYYLAYRIAGTWNITVFTITILLIQALVGLIFVRMFPRVRLAFLLPFLPGIVLGEVKTGSAMTLLITALILWMIKLDWEKPRPARRYLIALLFGLGLLTKFLVIPLMAAYYWHKFDPKRLRSLLGIAVDVSIALATAVGIMAPYGVANVFKSTVLLNLVLKDRAVLATFFANALSGPMTWLGLESLYSITAVVILGLAVLAAPRLSLFSAMMLAVYVFLFVSPTPEAQFLPLVFFLAISARLMTFEREGTIPGRLLKPSCKGGSLAVAP
jgi:hypothetical protein